MTEFQSGIVWLATNGATLPNPQLYVDGMIASSDATGALAAPSSRHPGSFNVAFWDGSTKNVNNTIDYFVYQRLMTSDGRRAQDPATGNSLSQTVSLSNEEF
jgi:prepilin-type processing-associated H-X9-DG protein